MNVNKNENIPTQGRLLDKFIQIPEITIFATLIITFAVGSLLSPSFLKVDNLLGLVRNVSYIGIVAIFTTLLLMSKGLDLSCDSSAAMSSVIFANAVINLKMPVIEAIALALGAALLLGFVNSILILRANMPSFVVTLGMLMVAKGVGFAISSGFAISGLPLELQKFINLKVSGIPLDVIIFIVIAIGADFVLRFTTSGRKIILIGTNYDTAILSGIKAKKIITMLYIGTALAASFAAIMFTFRARMGMLDVGTNWSLQAITACVIGGTSIYGGTGSILGTVLGVIFMGSITNIMVQTGVSSEWQYVGLGLFMIVGILLDLYRSKKMQ